MSPEAFRKYLAFERQYSGHTVKAYLRDLRSFESYCKEQHGDTSMNTLPYTDYQELDHFLPGRRLQ